MCVFCLAVVPDGAAHPCPPAGLYSYEPDAIPTVGQVEDARVQAFASHPEVVERLGLLPPWLHAMRYVTDADAFELQLDVDGVDVIASMTDAECGNLIDALTLLRRRRHQAATVIDVPSAVRSRRS